MLSRFSGVLFNKPHSLTTKPRKFKIDTVSNCKRLSESWQESARPLIGLANSHFFKLKSVVFPLGRKVTITRFCLSCFLTFYHVFKIVISDCMDFRENDNGFSCDWVFEGRRSSVRGSSAQASGEGGLSLSNLEPKNILLVET